MINDYSIKLSSIVMKMTEKEILVLDALHSTTAFDGIATDDLLEENINISKTKLSGILSKLVFIGAIDYKNEGKRYYYYITETGEKILEILSNQD